MICGVIFDLDGVLVSTDELHYRAWKQLADAEGIRFDRHINHRLRGVSRMDSLEIILETLSDCSARTKDPEILTEYARNSLARSICAGVVDEEGRLYVVTLDPNLEDVISEGIEHTERGSYLTLAPSMARRITRAIAKEAEKLTGAGHSVVVLVAPQIRLRLKRMTETELPSLIVLSYNEIVRDVKVESMGMVVVE